MIRSSKLYFRDNLNDGKIVKLNNYLAEYRRVAQIYLDVLWEKEIHYNGKIFSIKNDKLDVPQFLSKTSAPTVKTNLSARSLKCCLTQILGIIGSVTERRRSALFIKTRRESGGQPLYPALLKTLSVKLTKPVLNNLKLELNSICADFQESNIMFNGFLNLKSLGKEFGRIRIPIKYNRQLNRWKNIGKLKSSFLVSENYVVFRYEIPKIKKTVGEIIGADTGLKTVLTLSNGLSTPKRDIHGHSLESIVKKVSRKEKGSVAFNKAQCHRKNFINWSINQLNFGKIKQINLENIININFGKRTSRKMQAWTNSDIQNKVMKMAEEQEVLVVLQDSTYKSQRCSECGLVRKSNRRGENYSCKHCGNVINADLNAAKNHAITLPKIPFDLCKNHKNLKGFFWNPSGFSDFGVEFTVPVSKEKED